jgi:spermidine synthase
VRVIGRYKGMLGEIAIWESEKTGDRLYREGEIFQSQSSATGESRLPYVKMMEAFMGEARSVLVLGCGGGNLATMLARSGKSVIVVDYNPISFDLAREFFGMPKDIPCIIEDFQEYLTAETRRFDGIAIDVGGPGFCYEEQFDPATCRSIANRLNSGGRMIMNMLVGSDHDAAPDKIGSDLSADRLSAWIFDQPGLSNRNVLIAGLPKMRRTANKHQVSALRRTDGERWTLRRPRRPSHIDRPITIDIHCATNRPHHREN